MSRHTMTKNVTSSGGDLAVLVSKGRLGYADKKKQPRCVIAGARTSSCRLINAVTSGPSKAPRFHFSNMLFSAIYGERQPYLANNH